MSEDQSPLLLSSQDSGSIKSHSSIQLPLVSVEQEGPQSFLLSDETLLPEGSPTPGPTRLKKVLVGQQWMLVHMGSVCFVLVCIAIFGGGYDGPPPTTKLDAFVNNPLDAWPKDYASAFFVMWPVVICTVTVGYYIAEPYLPAKKKKVKSWFHFFTSICFISTVGFISLWLAAQETIHEYGLTHEVWGLVFGMCFCNIFESKKSMPAWMGSAARGEDFIKVGLVLMGLDITTVIDLAGPAIMTSWPITFVVLWFAYFIVSERMLGTEDSKREGGFTKSLAMMLSVGLAVCGSSAATARDPRLGLVIAILNAFTIWQMVVWPYFAYAVGFPLEVAAAWFGGTIDGMGNVVASGSIFDELYVVDRGSSSHPPSHSNTTLSGSGTPATDIASTVKIIQIMLICPVTICVTIYWMLYVEESTKRKNCKEWLIELYDRFPKFVIGFLFYAIVLTIVKEGTPEEQGRKLEELVIAVRTWWFTIGFVGVGMTTHIKTMYQQLKGGKALVLYCMGQGFDLIITLGAAYLFFIVVFEDKVADFLARDGAVEH